MTEQYLIVRWPDGRTGAVLESSLANPELSDNFKGAHIVGYEDGHPFDGPTTAEGVARKAERVIEARRETRRERHEAREAVRQVEVAAEAEPERDRKG